LSDCGLYINYRSVWIGFNAGENGISAVVLDEGGSNERILYGQSDKAWHGNKTYLFHDLASDMSSFQWLQLADSNFEHAYSSFGLVEGGVVLVGGQNVETASILKNKKYYGDEDGTGKEKYELKYQDPPHKKVEIYDIENDRWYEDSDFPISEDGIRDHITISRNGEVLILGGQLYTGAINWMHDSDATNKVWSGKRKSGVWTMEWTLLSKTMLEARRRPAVLHVEGGMFLFHSKQNSQRETGVEKWTWAAQSSNDWDASVPFTTSLASKSYHGNEIPLIGKVNRLFCNITLGFLPENGKWDSDPVTRPFTPPQLAPWNP